MLYNKEAAIAAIAIMLVAAPFLGGFLLSPAFAAEQVAAKTITQDDEETTSVGAVEFDARKVTTRTDGNVLVSIVQDGEELASTSISAKNFDRLHTLPVVVPLDEAIDVTGTFDITIEYDGSGGVIVVASSIEPIDGETDTAGEDGGSSDGGTSTGGDSGTPEPSLELNNVVARKTVNVDSGEQMTVEDVTFSAKKDTTRTDGDVIVAIVQGNVILDTESITANDLDRLHFVPRVVTFDSLEVTGDFEVVFMHQGRGDVSVTGINVAGDTSPASNPGSGNGDGDGDTDTSENVELTVEAFAENGAPLSMYITIWSDNFTVVDNGYTTKKFTLPDGNYVVEVHNFNDIQFLKWEDSTEQSRFRTAALTNEDTETFTAIYSAPGVEPPGDDTDTAGDPPTSGEEPPAGEEPPTGEPPAGATPGVLTVNTILLNGSPISGFQTQLRDSTGTPIATEFSPATFDQMEDGQTYRVVMYSSANTYFRNWENNGLHRYHSATSADEGDVFTAKYEFVPSDQAAHLVIMAKTTNGTPIGGTTGSDTDGTLSAEAGLEVLVAPPGTMTPYTAGFTGGSEISEHFYFPKGGIYTVVVQEFGQYQFSHWEDNGSENRARAVPLNGDTTLTAIYEVVP